MHVMQKSLMFLLLAAPTIAMASAVVQTDQDVDPTTGERTAFGFADVNRIAESLAQKPYEPDRPELPEGFRNLEYDDYRDIRYRAQRNIWVDAGLPFQIQLFPRGFLFRDRVRINVVDDSGVHPIQFERDMFDYGRNQVPAELPADFGFAGFRILYPLHREDRLDEVGVFLGASYFRAIGQNQNYGVSARGLAIDTGLERPEEFPVFREFWIQRPKPDDTALVVFALLDSQRATGAYRFIIQPGLQTVVGVKARLTFRESVEKLGVAPLTSMFYHGESTDRFMDDFRPEVHDSDGLIIESGSGERIWRPLANPLKLQITSFQVDSPRGFGLMQRDREFAHYQDTEALYHTRPSAWVETIGDWGNGVVELVEIPSPSERNDNIVAFWTPGQKPQPMSPFEFEYRLHFALDPEARLKGGRTYSTRIGAGGTDVPIHARRKFVIDFIGNSVERLDPQATNVEGVCNTSSGRITEPVAHHNPFLKGWRLFFELIPQGQQPADLRCFLRRDKDILTETWVYKWAPN